LTLPRFLPPVAIVLVAFLAAGCGAVGRVTSGDPSQGKALFLTNCAGCHTLADAKSTGTIGPNLDDAFSSDKQQGFDEQTMKDVVRGQIAYPDPSGPMKANIVKGSEANSVATYIAQCSGDPNCGVTPAAPPGTTATPTTPTTSTPTTTAGTTTSATPATTTGENEGEASAAELAQGKQIFLVKAGCGGCHTLKDAGSTGTVGPNLDQLKPDDKTVEHQVENGGGPMPAFKGTLTAAQIAAVSAYVSSVAGK
jgi:mono/diheme cytochrome c family protein